MCKELPTLSSLHINYIKSKRTTKKSLPVFFFFHFRSKRMHKRALLNFVKHGFERPMVFVWKGNIMKRMFTSQYKIKCILVINKVYSPTWVTPTSLCCEMQHHEHVSMSHKKVAPTSLCCEMQHHEHVSMSHKKVAPTTLCCEMQHHVHVSMSHKTLDNTLLCWNFIFHHSVFENRHFPYSWDHWKTFPLREN
jgi:hypothetical protein